jgi:metal-sulfur cluster biosynthetic enzyme
MSRPFTPESAEKSWHGAVFSRILLYYGDESGFFGFGESQKGAAMVSVLSEQDVLEVVEQVKHPAIDYTLVDLGMIRDVSVEGQKVTLTFVFPFAGVPIKQMLIDSVRKPLQDIGAELEVSEAVMSPDERKKFMEMEQKGWKGGI